MVEVFFFFIVPYTRLSLCSVYFKAARFPFLNGTVSFPIRVSAGYRKLSNLLYNGKRCQTSGNRYKF